MCAPTRKSCGSAAAASVPAYDDAAESEPAGFGSDIGKTEGKSRCFQCFLSPPTDLNKNCSLYQADRKITRLPYNNVQQCFQKRLHHNHNMRLGLCQSYNSSYTLYFHPTSPICNSTRLTFSFRITILSYCTCRK